MGNSPSSTCTEPLAQSKHRNLSTISLPPTIPRRTSNNIKDAERKEIFPISDKGAPPFLAGRRGSIGFFRGKRARAPVALDHNQLFKNLQNLQDLQNLDMSTSPPSSSPCQHHQHQHNHHNNRCSWQAYQYLSDSNVNSNPNSLSTTPTTATTTPALTASVTPTTPVGPQSQQQQQHGNGLQRFSSRSPQPTSPVAASIKDYHSRQEQKLAIFMKRNLLPPHALLTTTPISSCSSPTNINSASSSPVEDCNSSSSSCCNTSASSNTSECGGSTSPDPTSTPSTITPTMASSAPEQDQFSHQFQQSQLQHQHLPLSHSNTYPCEGQHQHHRHNLQRRRSSLEQQQLPHGIDSIPSTLDVPSLTVSEWGNQGRWVGEQGWSDDIPEGLEHDGGPWDTMDSYTVEQHITRALFKGQNYSAPLDFSKNEQPQQQQQLHDINEIVKEDGETVTNSCQQYNDNDNDSFNHNDGDDDDTQKYHESKPDLDIPSKTTSEEQEPTPILSSSFSSLATLDPATPINNNDNLNNKENERSLVILSVGCGNSQWATEMALAHPQSAVHAINVSQIHSLPMVPESTPSFDLDNLFFYNLDDNSLRVPFVSNSVDYIHVRRFLPNVSKLKYLAFLKELVRVLKVDGYMELVELDPRLRGTGIDSCWPSYWTLIGFDKLGIDTSLALNLGGILRTMPGLNVVHKSSVNMPVGIHGGRIGLAAELLCWKFALTVRPWLMRQAMLSGSEFDELLERARSETRTLKSYQVCHVAVARKSASTTGLSF